MPLAFNQAQPAVWKTARNMFVNSDRERPVFRSMPKPDRNIDIFQSKFPWPAINFRVVDQSFDGGQPCAALTFKAGFKRDRVFERIGIRSSQAQEFQHQWTQSRRRPDARQ